ncbi:putative polysaccharide biosynthesis protein [Ferroacidibacillus organovorans]|uniref:Uncharacterized protein n=1 Tax=Ferroacidibacillus organovorans TaxID=1765683 RepID=A0A117SX58_9BACL|nr:polysaccharide biosynthesis protein [Ferroacidibacillus organovorans]KUO94836.1 hypothetical protein ATW55_10530 [Ferroacidibacillus organovorans]
MKRQSFIAGTSILIAASLITRLLGFVYRIALTRLIGSEGIGLFQMVFPILTLVLTIVSAGMGTAISKLVAESLVTGDRTRIRRVMRYSFFITSILAVIFTWIMLRYGKTISLHMYTDRRAYYPLITLTPVIGIIAISSVLRGYFQGLQQMSIPSVASIIETLIRIVGVWIIAALSLKKGIEYAAAGVSAGMILGELAGCLYMYYAYRRYASVNKLDLPEPPQNHSVAAINHNQGQRSPEKKDVNPSGELPAQTMLALLQLAIPVTFSRLIGSIAFALEPILVMRALLTAGLTATVSTKLYGAYSGMAIPLLVFPTVFTYSLAVQLVPSISEAVASGRRGTVARRLTQSFRITALIGFPTSLMLLQFATPLCTVIYAQPKVGHILAIMAPSGFLLYLQGPLSGILQGINRASTAMRNSLIGSAVKLLIIYLFASTPSANINAVAWSLTIAVSLTTLLHMISVHRAIGFYVDPRDTAKTLLCTILMGVSMHVLWPIYQTVMPRSIALSALLFTGLLIYIILLLITRTITANTLARLPGVGRPLSRVARLIPFSR